MGDGRIAASGLCWRCLQQRCVVSVFHVPLYCCFFFLWSVSGRVCAFCLPLCVAAWTKRFLLSLLFLLSSCSGAGSSREGAGTRVPPAPGRPVEILWTEESGLAGDHIAAGSFQSAMQILNKSAGIVNFAPLRPYFLGLFSASRGISQMLPSLPPLVHPLAVRHSFKEVNMLYCAVFFAFC